MAKPLTILLLLLSSITNYLMFTYGVYIDADMIRNACETNRREAFDLIILQGCLWVLCTGILPALLISWTKINYFTWSKELKFRCLFNAIGFILLALCGIVAYKEYAAFGRNNNQVRKLINTLNYPYATIRYFQKQARSKRVFVKLDEQAKTEPYPDPYKTVLILVVGETARAKNFSLYGYGRETNPLLQQQDIITFQQVQSCGTATALSLPCMFSNSARPDFDVVDAKYIDNLLDVLQRSGYDILWLENDDGCKGVCKRVPTEDLVEANHPDYCDVSYCLDEVLIHDLEARLSKITQDTVIVLHGMGSHGPTYYKRYPPEFRHFIPTCDTAEIQNCTQEAIINTYDNTILYTDYILSSVIDVLKKFPNFESGMLYVSDHGESLGEKNIYLHGIPYQIAPDEQTHIPMILWMSEQMKQYDYLDYACLKQEAITNAYSHDNLFHSLLSLLEINTTTYDKNYDIFLKCRTKLLPYH